jgi:uncharacterized protein (DUF1778 family)
MAKNKVYRYEAKRMNLMMDPEVHAVVMDAADVLGMTGTRFVMAVLQESVPTIKAMVEAAKLAKQGNPDALKGMQKLLNEAVKKGKQASAEAKQVEVEWREKTKAKRKEEAHV